MRSKGSRTQADPTRPQGPQLPLRAVEPRKWKAELQGLALLVSTCEEVSKLLSALGHPQEAAWLWPPFPCLCMFSDWSGIFWNRFFFLYCGVKSVSKQNYHSNLNSNKICFAISIQRRGKVTREVGKKEWNLWVVGVLGFFFPFFNNRYRIFVRDFKANGEIAYTVMGLFLSFIFMTAYLYLRESFQRVRSIIK